MIGKAFGFALLILLLGLVWARCTHDPLETRLPIGQSDLTQIQTQLDQLNPEDRKLVLQYLARSKGDVLPAQFADPDEPLTARTFAQAIKLQKDYNAKSGAEDARRAALGAARDAQFAPLRDAVTVTIIQREILDAAQAEGASPDDRRATDGRKTLVVTYRLHNRSRETVTSVKGAVTVRSNDDPGALMGLARCWIEYADPIATGGTAQVRCANARQTAGADEQKFVSLPSSSLVVTWEPQSIEMGSGKVLSMREN